MRTKFIRLLDTMTCFECLLIQFDEADSAFMKRSGCGLNTKIILKFSAGRVSCLAGYDFKDAHGQTVEKLTTAFEEDGTINAFKEILHNVENIKYLPDEIDVKQLRETLIQLRKTIFLGEGLRRAIDEFNSSEIRKVLFLSHGQVKIALIDVKSKEVVWSSSVSEKYLDSITTKYLWIPLDEAAAHELNDVDISPFKIIIL